LLLLGLLLLVLLLFFNHNVFRIDANLVVKATGSASKFIQYIEGGCEISLLLAIDFSAANGLRHDPKGLHYLDPTGKTQNPYEHAISLIGGILDEYDTDKKYRVYGYGADIRNPTEGNNKSKFRLHSFRRELRGIDGILQVEQLTFFPHSAFLFVRLIEILYQD
jgi:hypothetical protein